jgi:hypothetical protein
MAKYAKGKHAVLISDRSGWKIKYKDARTEWTGARVSKFEWEAKQPQLDPQKYLRRAGAQGNVLYNPRPDNDSVPTTVRLGPLHGKYSGQAATWQGQVQISLFEDASGFELTASQGTVVISIITIPTGIEATSALGTTVISLADVPDGIAMTAEGPGTVIIPGIEVPDGMYVTASYGTLIFSATEIPDGIEATSAQGTVNAYPLITVTIDATSLTMTAQQGTISVTSPSWGMFAWGDDTWGE